jgi:hypothetical protein
MPYLDPALNSDIRSKPLVLCRVVTIETLFPGERSIGLMNQYGKDCSDVLQSAKMIQRLTLQVVESVKDVKCSD